MTHTFTVELSDGELKALHYVAVDADSWIQNAIHERCRLAIEELVQDDIQMRMRTGLPISGTRDEIVLASELPSASERNAAMHAVAQAAQVSMYPPSQE